MSGTNAAAEQFRTHTGIEQGHIDADQINPDGPPIDDSNPETDVNPAAPEQKWPTTEPKDSDGGTGEGEHQTPEGDTELPFDIEASVADLKAHVEEHPEDAQAILEAEHAAEHDDRKTLVEPLEKVVEEQAAEGGDEE